MKNFEQLTVKQAEQVIRDHPDDDPYQYVYLVIGNAVIARSKKK